MAKANINSEILVWACERLGFSLPEFARKLGKTEERLTEWESGERSLTFNQAMDFAKKAHIPFGYLFLAQPPIEDLPLPDLRTVNGQGVHRPSAELLDLIKLMLQRQDWYKDYLKQQFAEPNSIVGSFANIRESSGSGPSYYWNKKAQISESFSRAVVSQALNGQVLLREAGDLQGMKPTNIAKFAQELSI